MNPVHWFQFADDAAVITTQESENQHLLNRFSVWCQWSNMFIRVEKCSTFGIKKSATKSIQFLPKLLINGVLIPTVKIGESFQYLGRYFNFDMSDDVHKSEIISLLEDLMSIIDSKPLHPKNKLLLYSRFVLSKLSWHFTISNISQTWVKENIDSVGNSYVRRWLEIPISGTLRTVFMSRNRFGLHIIPPSVKFLQCQTTLRNALKTSPNVEINELWKSTSTNKNIQYDVYTTTKEVIKDFRSKEEHKLQNQLSTQGSFFKSISKFALSQLTKLWSMAQSNLPKNIFSFSIRYINNSLPTGQNLVRWNLSPTSDCRNCLQRETLLHVVAGCKSYLDRFTWRHDSVLNFLAKTLSVTDAKVYADLPGYNSPSIITGDEYRTDMLLLTTENTLYVAELTVGHESNLENNSIRKRQKYSKLVKELKDHYKRSRKDGDGKETEVRKNREVMKRLIDITLCLAQQGMAFRGHREVDEPSFFAEEEVLDETCTGNFSGVVNLLAKYDASLSNHIRAVRNSKLKRRRNPIGKTKGKKSRSGRGNLVSFMSADSQNKIINSIGKQLQKFIVGEINAAGIYSIAMDCTTDSSHADQLSIIIRYLNRSLDIVERLVSVQRVKESSAEGLFNTLQEILKESSLSLKDVGQSYDGASVMTGKYKGVKTLVQQVNPQCIFIWTFDHVLNLVIMEACGSSLAAKSLFGALEKLYAFFSQSRKRSDILE